MRYKVRPCRARVLAQVCNEKQKSQEYDKFCSKVCRYKYRCQPLIGNKIAANFLNIDSSNKHGKPVLSCNVNKATKLEEIMLNSILIHSKNTRIVAN